MLSTWYWKSIDLHFSLYFNFTSCPVKWNAPKRLFIYDLKRYRDYIPWFISTFFLLYGIAYNSIILVLIRQWFSPRENITALPIAIYSLLAIIGTVPLAIIFAGRDTVAAANNLISAKAELKQLTTDGQETKKHGKKPRNLIHSFFLQFKLTDILDYFAYAVILLCALFPFVFAILPYFLNINPFVFLLEDVIPMHILQNPSTRIPIEIISALIIFFSASEGFRLFPFINLFVILTSILWLHVISLMNTYFDKRIRNTSHHSSIISNRRKMYLFHTKMTIVKTIVLRFAAPEAFLLINIGKKAIVFLIFMTIRMHKVLPTEICILLPLFTFEVIIITTTAEFAATEVYEQSLKALKRWEIHGTRSKLIKKMFSSLIPFSLASGFGGFIFYQMSRDTFTAIIESTLAESIDFLVSVPPSVIEEWNSDKF
jgi:hypothetical protein